MENIETAILLMVAGATFTSWSTRGTYFPADCHISRNTKLNFTSLFMSFNDNDILD